LTSPCSLFRLPFIYLILYPSSHTHFLEHSLLNFKSL
jgi:hypothetical protein